MNQENRLGNATWKITAAGSVKKRMWKKQMGSLWVLKDAMHAKHI